MKKIVYITFLLALLVACENNKKKKISNTTNTSTQTIPVETSIKSELEKLTPLTNDQLKMAFPKDIYDLTLDKDAVVNGQTISGHFGSRKITLGITDSAGDNYLRATYFLEALNDESFTDTDDTKYIKMERNGIQTFAKHYVGSHTELEFLYKNRFHIRLISKMNPNELWDAFDIKALESYK